MSWKSQLIIPVLSKLASTAIKFPKKETFLTILAYHRIMEQPENYPLDEGVISTDPKTFEKEMEFCGKHFNCITFQYLRMFVAGRVTFLKNPLIVTFDDGYRDNYTNAFPILRKYGLTATIFLTVEHINSGELFWWDIAAFAMKQRESSDTDLRHFFKTLKSLPNTERLKQIHELKEKFKLPLSRIARQTLTWDEIREMSQNYIEFGSHTMSHPVLSKVSDERQLEYELRESKRIIEERLGKKVSTISYPVGGPDAFTQHIQSAIEAAGYDFAISYIHGQNKINPSLNLYNLKRLDADKIDLDKFKSKLAFPNLFGTA